MCFCRCLLDLNLDCFWVPGWLFSEVSQQNRNNAALAHISALNVEALACWRAPRTRKITSGIIEPCRTAELPELHADPSAARDKYLSIFLEASVMLGIASRSYPAPTVCIPSDCTESSSEFLCSCNAVKVMASRGRAVGGRSTHQKKGV
ncbi:hypothetical protein B0H14DRAFT_3125921 [Mycena olivaceomarginata]|nr:hypothetical protein B0H14DRAFT_3125921 [Mycena olivaceomarginata]